MTNKTEFRAYTKDCDAYGDTPQQAAQNFFNSYPSKRKCNIIEGLCDGHFFRTEYKPEKWPKSFKDITKKQIQNLPNE